MGCLDFFCVVEFFFGLVFDNGDNCSYCLVYSVRYSNCSLGFLFYSSIFLFFLKYEREIFIEFFYRVIDISGICFGFFYLSDILCYIWLF